MSSIERICSETSPLGQLSAIGRVASLVVDGSANALRRDAEIFRRKRLALRCLASDRTSFARKKRLVSTHHTLVPVLLRIDYVIRAILREVDQT